MRDFWFQRVLQSFLGSPSQFSDLVSLAFSAFLMFTYSVELPGICIFLIRKSKYFPKPDSSWLNQCYSIPSNKRDALAPAASTDFRGLYLRAAGLGMYRKNNSKKGCCVRCETVTNRLHLSKHSGGQNNACL